MKLDKLTKALEQPKAAEILDILNSLEGIQLLFAIAQIKDALQKSNKFPQLLLAWILEDQSERIKNATTTSSIS